MHRILLFALLLVTTPLAADTETEIRAALDYFAEVWNQDDLTAIEGYYHPDFRLVTRDGVISREQRLDDFRAIVGEGGDRGELSYSQVSVRELGPGHAMAWGRISLAFDDGSALASWFSTVYVKTPFGWKALLTNY